MSEKHSSTEVEHANCISTLSDSYEEISKERGRSVIEIDSRVMELIHRSGATFTLYEKSGTGYVGCLMTSEQETRYYEVDPSKVVDEDIELPEFDCQFVEPAVLPLLDTDWQLTYYDAEYTKTKMYQIFNGDSLV